MKTKKRVDWWNVIPIIVFVIFVSFVLVGAAKLGTYNREEMEREVAQQTAFTDKAQNSITKLYQK